MMTFPMHGNIKVMFQSPPTRSIYIYILSIYQLAARTAQGGGGSFKDKKPIGEVGCCDAWMADQSH